MSTSDGAPLEREDSEIVNGLGEPLSAGAAWATSDMGSGPLPDRDEWKYGPVSAPEASGRTEDAMPTPERAAEIEATLRTHLDHAVRDRKLGVPWGLIGLLFLLGALCASMFWITLPRLLEVWR